jgi:Tol biopolymer transport system component
MRSYIPFLLFPGRVATLLLISCSALTMLAAFLGEHFQNPVIIYTADYKLRLFDIERNLETTFGGDYLTYSGFLHITPAASPDAQWIAVTAGNDGVQLFNLKNDSIKTVSLPFAQPIWSPDSQSLATIPLKTGDMMNALSNAQWMDIHVADADTGEVRQITPSQQFIRIWALGWSADSQQITFVAMKSPLPDYTFYRVNRDGDEFHPLDCSLSGAGIVSIFTFAPGGEHVIFSAQTDDTYNIYGLDLTDCSRTRLSDGKVYDDQPHWSTDGERIAFLSTRDGQPDIYVMNADGSQVWRLTNNPDNHMILSWSADGHKLLFLSYPANGGSISFSYADLSTHTLHPFDMPHAHFQSFPAWQP